MINETGDVKGSTIVLTIRAGSSFGSKRLARTALLGVVAAIGILPMTAAAQEATAQQGHGFSSSPLVRRLDAVPQITAAEIGQHPPALAPLTGVSRGVYAARKARAASLRGTRPSGGPVEPATPAQPGGAVFTPGASV